MLVLSGGSGERERGGKNRKKTGTSDEPSALRLPPQVLQNTAIEVVAVPPMQPIFNLIFNDKKIERH